jgi:hypothetical protein
MVNSDEYLIKYLTKENSSDLIKMNNLKEGKKKYVINEFNLFDPKFKKNISKDPDNHSDDTTLTRFHSQLILLNLRPVRNNLKNKTDLNLKFGKNLDKRAQLKKKTTHTKENKTTVTTAAIITSTTPSKSSLLTNYKMDKHNEDASKKFFNLNVKEGPNIDKILSNSVGRLSESPINDYGNLENLNNNHILDYKNCNIANNNYTISSYKTIPEKKKKSYMSIFSCFC